MLSYLYTFDYDDESSPRRAGPASCLKEPRANHPKEDENQSALASTSPKEADTSMSDKAEVRVSEGNSAVEEPWLLNNVLVYAIADKYGIFELKELAKAKFLARADSLMSTDDFPEIIKTVYTLPDSDRALRDAILDTCMSQLQALMDNVAFTTTVKTIGDFGFDILSGTLKQNAEQLKQISVQKAALKKEVARANNEVKQVKQALLHAITAVNHHEACKNCGAGFCCLLDADDLTKLKCAKCGTRHWYFSKS